MRREQRKQVNLVLDNTETKSTKSSSSETIYHYQVKTNGGNLHVRKGPSTSHEIIAKMPNGSKFDVTEIKSGWGKHAHIGTMGWSSLDWAKKIGETKKDKEEEKPPEDPPKTDGSKDTCESILDGTIALREPDLTIKAKKGVTLKGLGSKLSGLYFVDEVTYKFDSGGLTQDIKVSREWIGESMKGGSPTPPPLKPVTPPPTTKPEVEPPKEKRTYTVKKGDTLWAISKKYYGKGSDYMKIANANKDKIKNPDLIQPGWVLEIP